MAVCSMIYFFVISYFIISDIQCSERITAKNSTVTNSSKKKNIDLLQLINQETLIRFELDKNVQKINSKFGRIKIDNKLASNRLSQEMLSINTTLSRLRKKQDETNEAVNIIKNNQTSTDSKVSLLKEEIKSFKQKQKINQKLASDQLNQEILSINETLSGLRKNHDETNEAFKTDQASTESEIGLLREELKSLKQKHVNLEYNQQKLITDLVKDKIENNLLKKEIESLKASQKQLILNVSGTLEDQVNIPISNIRTSLLRSQQEQAKLSSAQANLQQKQAKLSSAQTRMQHKQAQISSAQANLQQKQTTLSSELSVLQNNYTSMIQYQVNIPISNIRTSLLRSQQEQAKLSSAQANLQQKQAELSSAQTRMQQKQTTLSSAQANLQQKQTTLSSELSVLQNNYTSMIQSRKSQVSFTAGVSSLKDSLSYKETIIYQHVISNIGKGYNAKTGMFTAPQEGTYVFYFSTYPGHAGRPLYLDIVRNGNTVTGGRSYDKDASEAVSGLAVIHLTAADNVWIRCSGGCDAGISNISGSYTSTFSGFML